MSLPRSLIAIAGVVVSAAGAAGCSGTTTINAASAARQISDQLASRYHVPNGGVTCPERVAAHTGTRFVCIADLDGQRVEMDATVTDGSGHFTVTPAEPIIEIATVAAQLEDEIATKVGVHPAVHCPAPIVRVVPVGQTFSCSATFPAQAARDVTVTIIDTKGDFGFQLAAAG